MSRPAPNALSVIARSTSSRLPLELICWLPLAGAHDDLVVKLVVDEEVLEGGAAFAEVGLELELDVRRQRVALEGEARAGDLEGILGVGAVGLFVREPGLHATLDDELVVAVGALDEKALVVTDLGRAFDRGGLRRRGRGRHFGHLGLLGPSRRLQQCYSNENGDSVCHG